MMAWPMITLLKAQSVKIRNSSLYLQVRTGIAHTKQAPAHIPHMVIPLPQEVCSGTLSHLVTIGTEYVGGGSENQVKPNRLRNVL